MENITKAWVGVDISKRTLDICLYPLNKSLKISNSQDAIEDFINDLSQFDVKQIACEATGGYEKLLAKSLKQCEYSLWIIDPRRIKGYIISTGCKSKNDKIDAQKIAEFAAKNNPDYVTMQKTESQEILHSLNNRKSDLTKILAAEKTRLKHPSHETCKSSIQNIIQVLKKEIKSIELHIKEIIQQDEKLNNKAGACQEFCVNIFQFS
jgi:transposase